MPELCLAFIVQGYARALSTYVISVQLVLNGNLPYPKSFERKTSIKELPRSDCGGHVCGGLS